MQPPPQSTADFYRRGDEALAIEASPGLRAKAQEKPDVDGVGAGTAVAQHSAAVEPNRPLEAAPCGASIGRRRGFRDDPWQGQRFDFAPSTWRIGEHAAIFCRFAVEKSQNSDRPRFLPFSTRIRIGRLFWLSQLPAVVNCGLQALRVTGNNG